jgi:cysteine desulfurase/selenocysteine lyase
MMSDTDVVDFEAVRARFPGAAESTYMNTAARGLLMRESRAAIDAMLDARMHEGGDKPAMFEAVEGARSRFAQLINAGADEVAITKNVSEGLNAIIAAIEWRAGDNAVLCLDLEHPNNVYPWRHAARRFGVDLRVVTAVDGVMPVGEMIDAIDANTRAVTLSSVTFAPGFRTDIAAIGQVCREHDALLLVDGVQSVGVLKTDVAAEYIDAMAVSTQKGLLGLYGMGFLYCRNEWAERLTPAYLARFGVDLGDGAHEAALGGDDWRLMPGARRFDLGNYNFMAATAVNPPMALMLDIGPDQVEARVVSLAHRLAGGLLALGLPVCGGAPGPHLAGLVAVGEIGAGQHDGTDNPAMQSLHDYLMANNVQLTIRRGILRFSLHMFNNEEDIDRVLELAAEWRRKHNA